MGKRKVTLDTNILISALGWKGKPNKIMVKIINNELELFLSYEQFEELSRVLDYPKFKFTEEQKRRFRVLISEMATFVKTPIGLDIIKRDPSDNRILECAMIANVDYIITGDKSHVLPLKKLGRIKIVTASEMLEILSR